MKDSTVNMDDLIAQAEKIIRSWMDLELLLCEHCCNRRDCMGRDDECQQAMAMLARKMEVPQ